MKRRWKILIGICGSLVALVGFGAVYIFTANPPPAEIVNAGPTGEKVNKDGVFGNFFPAMADKPRPAILVLGGSEGGLSTDVSRQARALQEVGYNALHLAYHNAPGKPGKLKNIPVEDFINALDWLKAQDSVDADQIGIIGYSKGAEAALLIATRYSGIRAVVAGMPSSVFWDGMSPENFIVSNGSSSWSEGGEPIASLPYGLPEDDVGMLSVFNKGLARVDEFPNAVIPIERYDGALLMVCGEIDNLWPSCQMAKDIEARARNKNGPPVTLLRYPEAGHGVMGIAADEKDPSIRIFAQMGGTAKANISARRDSWSKILLFFEQEFSKANSSFD